ncbi:hypothetical protein BHE74_00035008, partial [Ensete ventricosum]
EVIYSGHFLFHCWVQQIVVIYLDSYAAFVWAPRLLPITKQVSLKAMASVLRLLGLLFVLGCSLSLPLPSFQSDVATGQREFDYFVLALLSNPLPEFTILEVDLCSEVGLTR